MVKNQKVLCFKSFGVVVGGRHPSSHLQYFGQSSSAFPSFATVSLHVGQRNRWRICGWSWQNAFVNGPNLVVILLIYYPRDFVIRDKHIIGFHIILVAFLLTVPNVQIDFAPVLYRRLCSTATNRVISMVKSCHIVSLSLPRL